MLMLDLLTLNNLGSQGVNQDVTKVQLPPEVFTDGNNYRLISGSAETFNGQVILGRPDTDINAGNLIYINSNGNNYYVLLGLTGVLVTNGIAYYDISSAIGYGSLTAGAEFLWSYVRLGNTPIVNNPQHYPEYWSPQDTSQLMQPLEFSVGNTWSDVSKSFKLIRAHKNILFALGLVEGAVEMPYSFRWSHPADINGLPYTWDETDLSSIAGISSLSGTYGNIIDGLSLRDSFCIYSQKGINILTYVGGEFIWDVRELTSSYGLLSADCVVEVNGSHYFISDGDILRNDGNSISSILHNRLRSRIAKSISEEYSNRSYAVSNVADKEIWFCLVEDGFEMPNLAIIYNWMDDSISIRELQPVISKLTAAPLIQGLINSISRPWSDYPVPWTSGDGASPWNDTDSSISLTAPLIWSNIGQSWDDYARNWDYSSVSPFSLSLVGTSPDQSNIIAPEFYNPGEDFNTYILKEGMVIGDQRAVKTIVSIYPHMEGDKDLEIQIGAQDYMGAAVRWEPAVVFNPKTDRKIDVRSTGKLHAWKISSIADNSFKFSGMDIEYYQGGLR
jgi:hypothetical protein